MNKSPTISSELLKYLDEQFPERCPDPAWTDRELWLRAGERRAVRHLHRIAKEQAERPLEHVHVNPKAANTGSNPAAG